MRRRSRAARSSSGRLNTAPGGTRMLVQMPGRICTCQPWERIPIGPRSTHDLVPFVQGVVQPRLSWLLQRIDWRTSALILERLIQHEAVHQIQGWDDLRRRLEGDRRCYAFFHPALPDEPLIFIEAALTQGILGYVRPLLDPQSPVEDPADARWAIFCSITNCQAGLQAFPSATSWIKQVVEDLSREFRKIRTFSTLSPIPRVPDLADGASRDDVRAAGLASARQPCVADRRAGCDQGRDHAALRVLPAPRQARTRAARSGRPVPSRERRPPGEAELGRRRVRGGNRRVSSGLRRITSTGSPMWRRTTRRTRRTSRW